MVAMKVIYSPYFIKPMLSVDLLCLDCAKALLAVHNVEINVQNKLGDTPLHNAAWKGHAEVVAALLEKGILTSVVGARLVI